MHSVTEGRTDRRTDSQMAMHALWIYDRLVASCWKFHNHNKTVLPYPKRDKLLFGHTFWQ